MTHAWHDVTPGEHLPLEFMSVIEIPMGSSVKYELDKETGLLRLDRILKSGPFLGNVYQGLQKVMTYPWAATGGAVPSVLTRNSPAEGLPVRAAT